MKVEGNRGEVALVGGALMAFAAGPLAPHALLLRHVREVPGEPGRLRGVVAELEARGLGGERVLGLACHAVIFSQTSPRGPRRARATSTACLS